VDFLTKPIKPHDLLSAVTDAIERDRAAMVDRREIEELRRRHERLSARERQIMAAVVAGRLNKEISADFGTKEFTVKEQRGNVMRKMQVSSLAELVQVAGKLGKT
jgi:FixJ family two-component response regulator